MEGIASAAIARCRRAGAVGVCGVVLAAALLVIQAMLPSAAIAEELTAGSSTLAAQTVTVKADAISLGQTCDVVLSSSNNYEKWFKFTVPKAGNFEFVSSVRPAASDEDNPWDDHGDPLGKLFVESASGDESGLEQIADDDDSAGNGDFRVVAINCNAGDVYYLRCGCYNDGDMHYVVTAKELDTRDISLMYVSLENWELESGTPATLDALGVYIRSWESNDRNDKIWLEAKKVCTVSDWKKLGYDDEGDEVWSACDANPSTEGEYSFTLTGKEPYHGKTEVTFRIYDAKSLGNYRCSLLENIWADGTQVTPSRLELALYRELADGTQVLKLGTDYEVSSWFDGSADEWITSPPSKPGYYEALLEGKNGYSGTRYASFTIQDPLSLSSSYVEFGDSFWADGTPVTIEKLDFEVCLASSEGQKKLKKGEDYEAASWWNDDTDEQLNGAPSEPGSYRVVLAGKNGYKGETSESFAIRDPKSLDDYSVNRAYTLWADGTPASAKRLGLALYATINGERKTLELDKDYKVAGWANGNTGEALTGAPSEPGYYRVDLSPIAPYTGSRSAYFEICDPFDLANVESSWANRVWADGNPVTLGRLRLELTPATGDDQAALVEGTDFNVKGWRLAGADTFLKTAPSAVGLYEVVLEGDGKKYTGTLAVDFKVVDPWDINEGCYTNEKGAWADGSPVTLEKMGFELVSNANGNTKVLTRGTDYEIDSWWTDEYTRKLDSAPSAPGYYYVRLVGKGDYHGVRYHWFQIRDPHSLANHVCDTIYSIWSNGSAVTPDRLKLVVKRDWSTPDSEALKRGEDYKVDSWWSDYEGRLLPGAPADPGYYSVKAAGSGQYKGTQTTSFQILDIHELSNYSAHAKKYIPYDEKGMTLEKMNLVVSATGEDGKDMVLEANRDFRVAGWETWRDEYDEDANSVDDGWQSGQDLDDLKKIGSYEVALEGISPYTGTTYVSFLVVDPADVRYATLTGIPEPCFVEAVPSLAPSLTSAADVKLKKGVDYTISLQRYNYKTEKYESVNSITTTGEYRYNVEGIGSYKGSKSFYFQVLENPRLSYDLAQATVTIAGAAYKGTAVKPAPVVKINGKTLVNGVDYTVAYKNNTKVGSGTATIVGKGFYRGTKSVGFKISKGANPIAVTASNPKALKYKTAAQTLACPLKVSKARGKVTYSITSAVKNKKSFMSMFKVNGATGNITVAKGTPVGTYSVVVVAKAAGDANYAEKSVSKKVSVKIAKATNALAVKAVKATQKASANKATTIAATKAFKVTKNTSKGKVTYKKTSGNAKISVAASGKITVKKGLKKGKTYAVKVKATSAATANYTAASKFVTIKIKVA